MLTGILNQHAINKRASKYVVRLYSGELTAIEEKQILNWCDESESHQKAFDEALSVWDMSANLSITCEPITNKKRPSYLMRSIAASVVLCCLSLMLVFNADNASLPTDNTQLKAYRTAIGEVSNVGLSDGSTISLNTDTRINVAFNNKYRELWLESGEAFFDIAKDKARPFLIHTSEKTIRVVGTKFNVKLSKAGLNIAVAEGIVSVESNPLNTATQKEPKVKNVLLKAGATATFNDTSSLIANKNIDSVKRAHSWRTGYLRFSNERLDKVINNFNRYRSKKILVNDNVAQIRVSGVFKLSDGDAIITALEETLPIEAQQQSDSILLVKK